MYKSLLLGFLAFITACGGQSQPSDLCGLADQHISNCFGGAASQKADSCDSASAKSVLGQSCEDLVGGIAVGKADEGSSVSYALCLLGYKAYCWDPVSGLELRYQERAAGPIQVKLNDPFTLDVRLLDLNKHGIFTDHELDLVITLIPRGSTQPSEWNEVPASLHIGAWKRQADLRLILGHAGTYDLEVSYVKRVFGLAKETDTKPDWYNLLKAQTTIAILVE